MKVTNFDSLPAMSCLQPLYYFKNLANLYFILKTWNIYRIIYRHDTSRRREKIRRSGDQDRDLPHWKVMLFRLISFNVNISISLSCLITFKIQLSNVTAWHITFVMKQLRRILNTLHLRVLYLYLFHVY